MNFGICLQEYKHYAEKVNKKESNLPTLLYGYEKMWTP